MRKLNVVEVDRRPAFIRNESLRAREERTLIERQLSSIEQERRRAYTAGFAAALDLIAQKTDEPVLANGTRDFGDEPTAPYPIIDLALVEP